MVLCAGDLVVDLNIGVGFEFPVLIIELGGVDSLTDGGQVFGEVFRVALCPVLFFFEPGVECVPGEKPRSHIDSVKGTPGEFFGVGVVKARCVYGEGKDELVGVFGGVWVFWFCGPEIEINVVMGFHVALDFQCQQIRATWSRDLPAKEVIYGGGRQTSKKNGPGAATPWRGRKKEIYQRTMLSVKSPLGALWRGSPKPLVKTLFAILKETSALWVWIEGVEIG